ncbi:MAG: hypothetical protein V1735_01850 [Nanoarchaeota archaeon]
MKRTISATIDEDLYSWLLAELRDRTRYRNKSHLIEIALLRLRQERKKP